MDIHSNDSKQYDRMRNADFKFGKESTGIRSLLCIVLRYVTQESKSWMGASLVMTEIGVIKAANQIVAT